jgi:hypothetical protein
VYVCRRPHTKCWHGVWTIIQIMYIMAVDTSVSLLLCPTLSSSSGTSKLTVSELIKQIKFTYFYCRYGSMTDQCSAIVVGTSSWQLWHYCLCLLLASSFHSLLQHYTLNTSVERLAFCFNSPPIPSPQCTTYLLHLSPLHIFSILLHVSSPLLQCHVYLS